MAATSGLSLRLVCGVVVGWALIGITQTSPDGASAAVPSAIEPIAVGPSEIEPLAFALPDDVGSSPQAQLGEEALGAMRVDWTEVFPEWRVEFHEHRSGLRALTFPHEKRIEVFVRDSDTVESLHRVLAHEFGHVVDVEWNTPEDRERWAEARNLAAHVVWWPDESAADFATGAGDFAEAFAVWETGIRSQSSVGPQPDADDLLLLAELAG